METRQSGLDEYVCEQCDNLHPGKCSEGDADVGQ